MDEVVRTSRRRAGDPRRRALSGPPLRIGAVLSKTFSAWGRNFVPFSLLSLVVHAPILAHFAWATQTPERFVEHAVRTSLVGIVGGALVGAILAAAYTYGVVQQLRGRPAPLGKTIGVGLARTPAAVATSLVASLLVLIPLAPAFVMIFLARSPGAGALFGFAGLVGMFVVLSIVWVAVPATVIERFGPGRAVARSATLTAGARLRIFAIVFLFGAVSWLLERWLDAEMRDAVWESARLRMWLLQGWQVVVAVPVAAIASAVGYHDLRVAKEGVDVEDLAKVFE
jgi:hypothetical protein